MKKVKFIVLILSIIMLSIMGCEEKVTEADNTINGPVAPSLVSPSNDAVLTETNTPTLVWNVTPNAVNYTLEVSSNSEFSNIEYSAIATDTIETTTVLTQGTYYWRVKAQNSVGLWGGWSSVWQFHLEEPFTGWTFGGSHNDVGYSVQQATDGGYIIVGYTKSYGAGGNDVWLIKTNASGSEEWNQTFGGSDDDYGCSVQQTTNGGYIIVGYTESYGAGNADVWLIKTDAVGSVEWSRTFGASGYDYGYSVQQTTDGGYIITGYAGSWDPGSYDVWLIKTDALGNKVWDKLFGTGSSEYGFSVQQTQDNGYIIVGNEEEGTERGVWLIKTDEQGEKLWDSTFGIWSDRGRYVQQTTDGGYIIAAYTAYYGGGISDIWLIKTDGSGNVIWDNTFGGSENDRAYSIQQTTDGGYIIAGDTRSYGAGNYDAWLIKTDASGSEEWNQTFGGNNYDYGHSVKQTTDGGYIIAGQTKSYGAGYSDVWLIKTDADGNIILP